MTSTHAKQDPGRSWAGAIGIGLGVSILTAVIMVVLLKTGVSPFPEPPSLAFAQTLLARPLLFGLFLWLLETFIPHRAASV